MENNIKKQTKSFLKKYDLSEVNVKNLRDTIQKQGYTIIEFNSISNNENVATLLSVLNLQSLAERSKGFTYADSQHRLVFIHEGLSDEEQLVVLAHEEGHIYCRHLSAVPAIGRDVVEEHEANEFAHYLLYQNSSHRSAHFIRRHYKAIIAIAIALIIIAAGCFAFTKSKSQSIYYGEYYITSTGNKYHTADCGYVKGKENLERLTTEQYESGEYEPCARCIGTGDSDKE